MSLGDNGSALWKTSHNAECDAVAMSMCSFSALCDVSSKTLDDGKRERC
jgi:hypothetical protein